MNCIKIKLLPAILLFSLLATIVSCNAQTQEKQPVQNASKQITDESLKTNFLTSSSNAVTDSGYGQIVKCSLKDKAGNLWFGTTWKGVFRYDGKSFTNFLEKDGLCSNLVNTIYEDAAGIIWLGTNNGVCRYDGKVFTNFPLENVTTAASLLPGETVKKAASKIVESIMQDKAGNMWFGIWGAPGNAGAYRYDGKSFRIFFPETPIQGIVEDDEAGIWLNSKRYNGKTFTDFSGKENVFKEQVVKSLKDAAGNIWFAVRGNGLYQYNGKSFTYFSAKDGFFQNRVSCIFQDKAGGIWLGSDIRLGTENGSLCCYNGKSFIAFSQVYNLGMYSFWTAVEDNNGKIWFGGRGGKLCCYDGRVFTSFSDALK